ncbi:MAG: sulfatase-like hydrolase/transferase [Pirellulaceae bacterium]
MHRLWLPILLFAALATQTAVADRPRPHIVFILADDLGYADLACYGNRDVATPQIDRLASEGTRFTQYYSGSPICSPSRAALTTGMFPARWKITSFLQKRQGNRDCEQADFLDHSAPSLARTLQAAGYATAHIGKWHLGGGRDVVEAPKFSQYGFDEHAGTYESPQPHPDITATDWIWSPEDKVKRWDRTGFFVDRTLDFLRRHKDRPCYVNLWLDDPHTPWVPSDGQLADQPAGPEQHRKLWAVLAEVDRQVGRLLAGLKESGLDDETLVIFASDNGALPTFGGKRNGDLRGSKLSLYEGGIRLPFIARWPGQVPAGRTDETTVLSAVDLFPTLCKLAAAPLPEETAFDGEDLSAAMWGQSVARTRPLYWEYGRNDQSFGYPKGRDRSPNVAIREGKWKLLVQASGEGAELYDLAADPRETKNVSEEHPDVASRLGELALAWRKSLP